MKIIEVNMRTIKETTAIFKAIFPLKLLYGNSLHIIHSKLTSTAVVFTLGLLAAVAKKQFHLLFQNSQRIGKVTLTLIPSPNTKKNADICAVTIKLPTSDLANLLLRNAPDNCDFPEHRERADELRCSQSLCGRKSATRDLLNVLNITPEQPFISF